MDNFWFRVVFVWVSLCTIWKARALPATNQVALLSKQTGRYVRVSEDGTIVANSIKSTASVFIMYRKGSTVQLEVRNKPGMFLMLGKINETQVFPSNMSDSEFGSGEVNATASPSSGFQYALVVDNATETSLTAWESERIQSYYTLYQSVLELNTSCYVAFDNRGKVVSPCGVQVLTQRELTIETLKPTA